MAFSSRFSFWEQKESVGRLLARCHTVCGGGDALNGVFCMHGASLHQTVALCMCTHYPGFVTNACVGVCMCVCVVERGGSLSHSRSMNSISSHSALPVTILEEILTSAL